MTDEDAGVMARRLTVAYAREGRPSISPEILIKELLRQNLYSMRSEA